MHLFLGALFRRNVNHNTATGWLRGVTTSVIIPWDIVYIDYVKILRWKLREKHPSVHIPSTFWGNRYSVSRQSTKRHACKHPPSKHPALTNQHKHRQECIPVGCVPPAAVAIPGGLPLGVGLETPQPDAPKIPLNFSPGCGPGNLQGMLGLKTPLRDLLQGMPGYHLQCMLGYHPPPVNRITDACETRMHSSRMHTGRSLTICCSLLPGGVGVSACSRGWAGGCLPGPRGVSAYSGGSALSWGVCLSGPRGVWLGVSAWSGGWWWWSACSRGVCLVLGGVCLVLGGLVGGVCLVPGVSAWSGGVCLVPGGGVSAWSGGVVVVVCLVPGGSAWSGGSAWRPPLWTESHTHVKT